MSTVTLSKLLPNGVEVNEVGKPIYVPFTRIPYAFDVISPNVEEECIKVFYYNETFEYTEAVLNKPDKQERQDYKAFCKKLREFWDNPQNVSAPPYHLAHGESFEMYQRLVLQGECA